MTREAAYALLTSAQALNLLLIAAEPSRGIGQPPGFAGMDLLLRQLLDVWTAAAVVCIYALHPQRLPMARAVIGAAVALAAVDAAPDSDTAVHIATALVRRARI